MKPNLQDPYCQFKSDWLRLLALCYRETLRKASRGAWGALIAASFIAGLDLPRPVWPQLVAHTPPPTPHKETAKALRGDSVATATLMTCAMRVLACAGIARSSTSLTIPLGWVPIGVTLLRGGTDFVRKSSWTS